MENAVLSFHIVLPITVMLALGYGMRLAGLWDETVLSRMNGIVFRVFFPIQLFVNIYHAKLENAFSKRLAGFAVLSVLGMIAVLWFVIPLFVKDNRRRSVMIQGIYRSNFILFGLPIADSVCGGQSEAVGIASVLIGIVIPIYNFMAVVVLERFRGGRLRLRKMLLEILTNPLILGSFAGLLALSLGLNLPGALDKAFTDIGKVNTPLALMVLGGTFRFSTARGNLKALLAAVVSRLVAVPGIFLPLAILMGFEGVELAVLLGLYAAPSAVSSFTMAQQMDADYELAGQIVVFSSVCAIVTIFGWIFLLKQMGYF